jgi:hypothetical protein
MKQLWFSAVCFAVLMSMTGFAQAQCATPTGAAGDQFYNTTYSLMQYCNGTNWVNMGSPGSGSSGTPGGSSGQLQYNNSSAFGGTAALVYSTSGSLLTATAQAATDKPVIIKGAASQSANLTEWQNSSSTVLATVDSGGRFAIGTTVNTSYSLTAVGNILATGFFQSSDARLKHDVVAFDRDPVAVVNGLNAVHFKWNQDNRADFGVIAQDVEKVLPEAVTTDANGMKQVSYEKLVLPVIEAVKKLAATTTALGNKLAAIIDNDRVQTEKLAALEARLVQLEKANTQLLSQTQMTGPAIAKTSSNIAAH